MITILVKLMSSIQVQKLQTLTGHKDAVYAVVSGEDPSQFFSTGGDGMVALWDLKSSQDGELIAKLPNSIYAIHSVGDLLVVGHNYDGIHLINPKEKKELASLKTTDAAIFDLQSHESDVFIATGDGALTVINLNNLAIKARLVNSEKSARTIAVNPKKGEMAVGYSDNFIRIFSLDNYTLKKEWAAHTNSIFTLRYSPDSRFLLSGSRDARLKAWDCEADYRLSEEVAAHMYAINSLSFSPDGKHFVTCSLDKSIKLWDADQLRLLKVIDKARHAGHGTSVNKLLWTAFDGQVVSASDDRTISTWKFIF
jgi:WD40 repeat protein